jgi:hypothetical protein
LRPLRRPLQLGQPAHPVPRQRVAVLIAAQDSTLSGKNKDVVQPVVTQSLVHERRLGVEALKSLVAQDKPEPVFIRAALTAAARHLEVPQHHPVLHERLYEIGRTQHGHVLSPSRYVRAETADDDDETFNEKMDRLTTQLAEQMAKGVQLDSVIRHKLEALGYAV